MIDLISGTIGLIAGVFSVYFSAETPNTLKEKVKFLLLNIIKGILLGVCGFLLIFIIRLNNQTVHFERSGDYFRYINNDVSIFTFIVPSIFYFSLRTSKIMKKLDECRYRKFKIGGTSRIALYSSVLILLLTLFLMIVLFSSKKIDEYNNYTVESIYVKQEKSERIYIVPENTYFKTVIQKTNKSEEQLKEESQYSPLYQNIYHLPYGTEIELKKGTVLKVASEYKGILVDNDKDKNLLANTITVSGETEFRLQKPDRYKLYFDEDFKGAKSKYKVMLLGDSSVKDRYSYIAKYFVPSLLVSFFLSVYNLVLLVREKLINKRRS